MITETIARALTLYELAQRLADEHSDPIVRDFAARAMHKFREYDNTEELQSELDEAHGNYNHLRDGIRECIKNTEGDRADLVTALDEYV